MNLDNLLAYQKKDMECKKIEKALNGKEKQDMDKARAEFEKAKISSEKAENHAAKIESLYKQALAEEAKIEKRVDQIANEIAQGGNSDALIEELKALKASLEEIEKKVSTYKVESEKAVNVYKSALLLGSQAKKDFETARNAYEKINGEKKGEYEKLKKERDALRSKVEEQLLAQYDTLIAQNIPYPFKEAVGDEKNMSCGGCSMTLSHKLIDELKEHGFCHCDSCRRIVYKRK